jgi:hypothetical protein
MDGPCLHQKRRIIALSAKVKQISALMEKLIAAFIQELWKWLVEKRDHNNVLTIPYGAGAGHSTLNNLLT